MTFPRLLFLIGLTFVALLLAVAAGALWYLYPPVEVDMAQLVPANSVFFATIPNATNLLTGYQTSKLKTLVESPNIQPLQDILVKYVGPKNVDLLKTFLPNLSGQSFIAITHFDNDNPQGAGLIAGMKPKAGMGDFDKFLNQLKTTFPDLLKQGKTGTDTVDGVDYQWIQGPGAADKLCVARVNGWIITCWGEASLQDWLERFHKKSTTSSLADDTNYRKALGTVGDNPMLLVYVNNHALLDIAQKRLAKTDPTLGAYLAQKLAAIDGAAVATRFENGELVDRFSLLVPRQTQLDTGMTMDPCPFETLKFTGPDTSFYWATSMNWKQFYKNHKDQPAMPSTVSPSTNAAMGFVQSWIHVNHLDTEQNIVDALGTEVSVQVDWPPDATYPEAGLFVKLDKPDDFKPTITAIIESVRQAYANSGVIKELASGGYHFASLEFVQSSFITPTITEDTPYLGIFLTENQAVRSFQRDESIGLSHNANFNRQIDDRRKTAAQIFFLDAPDLLNRGYQTALPYISLAQMFNKDLAAALKDRDLPPDLNWLAPMGTWSCVITPDEEGIEGYSVSGIGNQGVPFAYGLYQGANLLNSMGFLPKIPAAPTAPAVPVTVGISTPFPSSLTAPTLPPTPNNPPATDPNAATNSAPSVLGGTNAPPAGTNGDATPAPPNAATNSAPLTNNALPSTIPVNPGPLQPQ